MRTLVVCGVRAAGRFGMCCSLPAGHREQNGTPHQGYAGHDLDATLLWDGPWEDDEGMQNQVMVRPSPFTYDRATYVPRQHRARSVFLFDTRTTEDEVVVDIEDESHFT